MNYNNLSEFERGAIYDSVTVCDVTLRDGEQQVDAAFTIEEKLRVLEALGAAGVSRVQVGFPRPDHEVVRRAKRSGLTTPTELLCIASAESWKEDIDVAVDSGVDVVHFLIRSKDELLRVMGLSRGFVLERTAACIEREHADGVPHR